ncbi:MAG: twin-arginine translocation signal domain-containing protein [Candidatus Aenigmarchaeota archaeon]|nr:twin-arginine translocation signal domain-containing protein [Candidatus Aenigmarchaeota archaeon]
MKEYVNNLGRELSRRDFLKVAGTGTAALLYAAHPAQAQEPNWILGVWEGAHAPRGAPLGYEDSARFEFFRNGGITSWKATRKMSSSGSGTDYLEISGRVLKMSKSSAELKGKYDMGSTILSAVGKEVSYSLKQEIQDDDSLALSGTAIGANNVSFSVKLHKKPPLMKE